jgi:transcriptional regulator with XRE-family HTH domain
MASRVRRIDQAKAHIGVVIGNVGKELRTTRISAGRSQRVIAHAARISQAQLARIELGKHEHVSLSTLITIATMEGLKLVVSLYPDGDVIRDAAQPEPLRRLRRRLGDAWRWRYEVLVAPGDQRAWDASSIHTWPRTPRSWSTLRLASATHRTCFGASRASGTPLGRSGSSSSYRTHTTTALRSPLPESCSRPSSHARCAKPFGRWPKVGRPVPTRSSSLARSGRNHDRTHEPRVSGS